MELIYDMIDELALLKLANYKIVILKNIIKMVIPDNKLPLSMNHFRSMSSTLLLIHITSKPR
jgi:hypothetical protein